MLFEVICAMLGTLSFSIMFQVKGNRLLWASLGGGIGWSVVLLAKTQHYSVITSFLFSAMAITIYSEIIARKMTTPVITTLIPSLIPLVPGSGIYYTMSAFIQEDYVRAAHMGQQTLSITAAIAIGIVFISSVSQILIRLRKYRKRLSKLRELQKERRN